MLVWAFRGLRQRTGRGFGSAALAQLDVRESSALEHLTSSIDVLSFYAAQDHNDPIQSVAVFKQLAQLAKTERNSVKTTIADGRFHQLLSDVSSNLDDLDARHLVVVAGCVAGFRTTTEELTFLTSALADAARKRPNAFTPNALASLTLAFAARRYEDEELLFFMTSESKKVISEAQCFEVILLLDGLNRWGVFDRELVDMGVERLSDQLDRFTSRDVTHLLGVMGQMSLARGFLIRSTAKMLFENLHQFTPRQLSSSLYALTRLRFTTQDQVLQALRVLQPEISLIPLGSVSELLFVCAAHSIPASNPFFQQLLDRFLSKGGNRNEDDASEVKNMGLESRPLAACIDVAWALCAAQGYVL